MYKKIIKVNYANRLSKSGYTKVPRLKIEGNYLRRFGFSIGDTVTVEYDKDKITFRISREDYT